MKAIIIALIFVICNAKCHSESNLVTKLVSKLRKAILLTSGKDLDESVSDELHLNETVVEISAKAPAKFLPLGCHNKQTFCENPAGYPSSKYLRKLVSNFTEVEKLILFTNNLRDDSSLAVQTLDFSVLTDTKQKTKVNPAVQMYEDHNWYQESPLCDTRTSYVYPKAALNQNLQWRYFT